MTTSEREIESPKRSLLGLALCAAPAAALFIVLEVVTFLIHLPIAVNTREAIDVFVVLQRGIYDFFSGRMFRSMILTYPPSQTLPPTKNMPNQQPEPMRTKGPHGSS